MNIRKMLIGFTISIVVITVLLAVTDRTIHAQSGDANAELMQKVDQIARDQQVILANQAAITEQLRILTIRVTQQQ